MKKKSLIILIAALILVAILVVMGAVIVRGSLERSDRTIAQVDRILDRYGR